MSKSNNDKVLRDRFLAFAFASADLLLEISEDGTILFVTGAVKSLTGESGEELEGSNWLNLFSPFEQSRMLALQEEAPNGVRCGPFLINMDQKKTDRKAVVTGIKMPYSHSFFITISLSNELMEQMSSTIDDEFDDSIYNQHQFIDAAEQVFAFAKTTDKEADLTVFDFERTETIPEEDWASIMGDIAKELRNQSLDGKAVAELADGRLGLIHDHNTDMEEIKGKIESLVKEKFPDSGDLDIKGRTIEGSAEELSAEDAEKAFYHTINELSQGNDISSDISNLSESLKTLVSENQEKIQKFTSYIETVNFTFNYQPVAKLNNHELCYYEMLCRFNDGDTKEWIKFGEDAGLAAQLDLAVCERVTNHLKNKLGGSRTMYAMNLSRHSLPDGDFVEQFNELMEKHKDLNERLIFEITGARKISPEPPTQKFIKSLRERGFKVALDGLGADARSIEVLNTLECDFVKLESSYGTTLPDSQHDQTLVANLAKLCLEKGIKFIGKHIETKEQAELMKMLKVEFGQGFYFGKPESQAAYAPPKD